MTPNELDVDEPRRTDQPWRTGRPREGTGAVLRVISGTARGRKIQAPPGRGTRPITDRAKEGIFNMLESLGGVEGAIVVDLFAGSGSFGIECLSRGAERVVFVERDRSALATLRANLAGLGLEDRSTVVPGAVAGALATLPDADVAFCDPPYADDPWLELLGALRAELLVGHAERPIALTDRWAELRRRSYGKAQIVIAERAAEGSGIDEPSRPGRGSAGGEAVDPSPAED